MKPYQREFIEFAIATGVLKFGQFTLKSGRVSPYFFNAGLFCTGAALAKLGRCYAAAVRDHADRHKADILFGPAYKGYAWPTAHTHLRSGRAPTYPALSHLRSATPTAASRW